MHYSDNPRSCRVDFFKDTGKWYATEAIDMTTEAFREGREMIDVFREVLLSTLKGRYSGMWAVCLEPYAPNPYPIMIQIP